MGFTGIGVVPAVVAGSRNAVLEAAERLGYPLA
jgi:hypothetical protein